MKKPSRVIIIAVLGLMILSICYVDAVLAQSTQVRAQASTSQPQVGSTLTIDINLSNGQSIFGVDVTLNWDPSVLQLISATPQLGVESHSNGVLHESSTYPIDILNNDASPSNGQYHLLATSTGSSTPAFTGSGTIATVTFTVIKTGNSGLNLADVQLSQVASDGTINLVNPLTSVDQVTPIASSTSSGASPSPTSSTSPSASVNPSVPEFSQLTIVILLIGFASVVLVASTKLARKNRINR